MLLLLLYPARKHSRLLRNLGPVKYWFKAHMLFGVLGALEVAYPEFCIRLFNDSPDVIRVRKGEPVILHITRNERAACSEEIVFEQLGIRQKLEPFKTTTIRFTPEEAGVIRFACGMDMLHGKIIVE